MASKMADVKLKRLYLSQYSPQNDGEKAISISTRSAIDCKCKKGMFIYDSI